MKAYPNCRACVTEVRCAELGRCLDASSPGSVREKGGMRIGATLAGSSVEDEIQRLKFKRLQAESAIMKARGQIVSAEIDIRLIDHCLEALSERGNAV